MDGVDTSTIPLHTLRSRIAMIPQEATMFGGTVRDNLAPLGGVSDDVLRATLEQISSLAEAGAALTILSPHSFLTAVP